MRSLARMNRGKLKRRLSSFAMWTLFGVVIEGAGYFPALGSSRPPAHPWWVYFRWGLTQMYIWWALTALFIRPLVRRYPVERGRWLRGLLVYVPAAALAHALWMTAFTLLYVGLGGPNAPPASQLPRFWWGDYMRRLPVLLLVFALIVIVLHALDYYRKYRERELGMVRAQLQALKMQLQPHFLFNTLNSVSMLIHEDAEAADRMIVHLGDLLRATLDDAGLQEVPLRRELELLESYLQIELIRFQNRLEIHREVGEDALDACVPSLILQPLVENAIRHGIAPHSLSGRVEVAARREDGHLLLSVFDDGPGIPEGARAALTEGVGLANTRARLRHLYGASHSFELKNVGGAGFSVSLRIPYRVCRQVSDDGEDTGADR